MARLRYHFSHHERQLGALHGTNTMLLPLSLLLPLVLMLLMLLLLLISVFPCHRVGVDTISVG